MPEPTHDGDVIPYVPPGYSTDSPRVYYVNGIQTSAETHARTALTLATLIERPVYGVYNASRGPGTALGAVGDLAQCLADWSSSFAAKVTEYVGVAVSAPFNAGQHLARAVAAKFDSDAPPVEAVNLLVDANRLIPEGIRVALIERRLGLYNAATRSLYRQLRTHRTEPQYIIAHSQGNLITCDALWAMVYSYGEKSLDLVRVYSLASPAPGWPLGIRRRRKVYGHTNDPVPFFDPHNWPIFARTPFRRTAGDWRKYDGPGNAPGTPFGSRVIAPHDVGRNAFLLNFANSIRREFGLPPIPPPRDVR